MGIIDVTVITIPVSDQDRSLAFYRDVLGLELVDDVQMSPEMRWIRLQPKGSTTGLTLASWFETMPAGSLRGLVLEVDDLEGTLAEMEARGLEHEDIVEEPWGRFVWCSDPDGNGQILQKSAAR